MRNDLYIVLPHVHEEFRELPKVTDDFREGERDEHIRDESGPPPTRSALRDEFAAAVDNARERLEARRAVKRALQLADAADVQVLIYQAKLSLPVGEEARMAFCEEVTNELKASGLVLSLGGEEIATALVVHKGSIACSTDRGPRGFLRRSVTVIPKPETPSAITPIHWNDLA